MELTSDSVAALTGLTSDTSFELLSSTSLGRISINGDPCPEIYPVRYAVDGNAVVFRADAAVQAKIANRSVIAFQADGYDDDRRCAWSVVLTGAAEEMPDIGHLETPVGFVSTESEPWARGDASAWVRVDPLTISGTVSASFVVDVA